MDTNVFDCFLNKLNLEKKSLKGNSCTVKDELLTHHYLSTPLITFDESEMFKACIPIAQFRRCLIAS